MSLWDSLVTTFSSDNSLASFAIKAGATIGSAVIQANANKDAARIAAEGERAKADAIRQANEAAQHRFDVISSETQPGVDVLRGITVGPTGLTPEQELQKQDLERLTLRSLNSSGVRGSGRATVAAIRRVGEGFTDRAIQSNRDRQDRAAAALAGANFSAGTNSANIDTRGGEQIGETLATTANNNANSGLANARITANTLADLASLTASENKARKSKFGSKKTGPTDEEDE